MPCNNAEAASTTLWMVILSLKTGMLPANPKSKIANPKSNHSALARFRIDGPGVGVLLVVDKRGFDLLHLVAGGEGA